MTRRKLFIEFEGAMHHGSGMGLSGLLDRPLLKNGQGIPYLSGGAVKGKLRHAALQLCRGGVGDACAQVPGSFCRSEPRCRLFRLFGSPWGAGSLRFSDAHPVEDQRNLLSMVIGGGENRGMRGGTEVRRSTAIDRKRQAVRRYHLFSTETAAQFTMESSVSGALTDEEWEFLEQVCQVLTHFGAGATRGLGRCTYRLGEEAEV